MVNDVMDDLKELTEKLRDYASQPDGAHALPSLHFGPNPQPLLRLRTGELVTESELTRRAAAQRAVAARQKVRGCHPVQVVVDEANDLDPEW